MRTFALYSSLLLAANSIVSAEETDATWRAVFQPFDTSDISGFVEQFVEETYTRWSPSRATKGEKVGTEVFSYVGQWELQEPSIYPGILGDQGLVVTNKAAHHAISTTLDTPLDPASEDVVVQYEVKLQNGLECGGAYIKLLTESEHGVQASEFSDKTPYSIMFGPDKCGATNKVHLIFRYKSPKDGSIEEKHLQAPPTPKISKTTTLYTLHLDHKAQTYEILIDDVSAKKGSLFEDFSPAFVPEQEIDDPEDKKPEDWVDTAKIPDPKATKPEDWDEDAPYEIVDEEATIPEGWLVDEPATIPDPAAEKPEEWDDEEDGDWIAPQIPNPKCEDAPGCGTWVPPMKANPEYKGKWYAPLIDNPAYKGEWKPKKIPNPAYYDDKTPLAHIGRIGAIGFEIWSMQNDILFDNIYVGSSVEEASQLARATFHVKKPIEEAAEKAAAGKTTQDDEASTKFALNEEFKKDPIGYLKTLFLDFYELAKVDPVFAFQSQPKTAAVIGGLSATLIGMLGVFFTLLTGSSKPKVQAIKKKSAETTDSKASVAPVTAAAEAQAEATAVRKRTAGAAPDS